MFPPTLITLDYPFMHLINRITETPKICGYYKCLWVQVYILMSSWHFLHLWFLMYSTVVPVGGSRGKTWEYWGEERREEERFGTHPAWERSEPWHHRMRMVRSQTSCSHCRLPPPLVPDEKKNRNQIQTWMLQLWQQQQLYSTSVLKQTQHHHSSSESEAANCFIMS